MIDMNKENLLVWGLVSVLIVAPASQCGLKKYVGRRGQSAASAVGGHVQNGGSVEPVENKSKVVSEPGASDNGVDVLSAADATAGSLAMPPRPVDDNGGTGKLVDSSNETGRSVVSTVD